MPRSATTGVFTRVSNSFSSPVFGTLIDPTDADAYFDDLDVGLNPPQLDGPVRIIDKLQVGTTGTAAGTIDFLNATSGSITLSPPAGALGAVTLTLPAATDTLVGKDTTDVLNNKSMNSPVINGGLISALTGFSLRDTSAAFNLTFTATSSPALSANRVLTISVNNANRILSMGGDITIPTGSGFSLSGSSAVTLTNTGSTNVTLPLSGTLMTLGNTETVTGAKTFSGAVTLSNDLTATQTTTTFKTDTADGADNKRILITGGGASGTDRGGQFIVFGNEFASTPGAVVISNGSGGGVLFPAITTTASAANAFLDSANNNNLLRSTSSLRYKKDVEPINQSAADAILGLEPIWYRSKAAADNPAWSWYGLGAEDVAKIDPRLVSWAYAPEDLVPDQVDGETMGTFSPKPGAEMVPDGVAYERLSVLLLMLVKKLEARVAALEAA